MSTNRRDFLKLAGAAAAAITSAAAAHAGVPASSVAKFDDEYDVVIIGSGFAGMACALKAGQAGKKVLILEKMPTVGGNSAICGGNVACPVNPVQAAQGIKDSKELFIADCLKDGLGINYPNLLGTIADRCNDTIKMVVEFDKNHIEVVFDFDDCYKECLDVIESQGHFVEVDSTGKLNIRLKEAV